MQSTCKKFEQFAPRDRRHWRAWLEKHHDDETEIWLVFLKKHTRKANLSYDDAVEEALCFGWIDGIKRSLDADRYMHRFSPRKPGSRWSVSNKARAERMIADGQMAPAGVRAIEHARANGTWQQPVSGPPEVTMPPEFDERLKANDKAATFFASLAPSYRREYVAWVASAKRAETRLRRINEAMSRLERGLKLGMR